MEVYIQGIGNISIQNTFRHIGFPEPVWYNEPYVRCIEPDFKPFITLIEARRMSRVIKRAIASAKVSMEEAGIEMPDAIISGTGLGCIEDTEKFLNAMLDNDEKFLQPTSFIQSTHNTISSQIAINLKCHGHNNTFVHGGVSFECALTEAMILFADKRIETALVGGHDEMTPAYFKMLGRVGFWKKDFTSSTELLNSSTSGSFSGEASISFMLSSKKSNSSYARIEAAEIFYQPENLNNSIVNFLEQNGKKPGDMDLLVFGINGDADGDVVYRSVGKELFDSKAQAWFKHLSGEYFTSGGFGLWFAAVCLKNRVLPAYAALNDKSTGSFQNLLLINHHKNRNFSLILLSSC
jgi:3-oxoacyl-[acyl-carrier-protein] synthase II